MPVLLIILLILAILLVIFTLQNSIEITLDVFFWQIPDAPLVLVLLLCILLGYVIAAIYLYPRLWKSKSEIKKLQKLNKELTAARDKQQKKTEENSLESKETNPEGIKFEDDENSNSFFND